LGERRRSSVRDQLDVVYLGVAGIAGRVERAIQAQARELGFADLSRTRTKQAAHADVLRQALGVRVVGVSADSDAVRRRAVAADPVDRYAERLAERVERAGCLDARRRFDRLGMRPRVPLRRNRGIRARRRRASASTAMRT
jgi:hypothetical protein